MTHSERLLFCSGGNLKRHAKFGVDSNDLLHWLPAELVSLGYLRILAKKCYITNIWTSHGQKSFLLWPGIIKPCLVKVKKVVPDLQFQKDFPLFYSPINHFWKKTISDFCFCQKDWHWQGTSLKSPWHSL